MYNLPLISVVMCTYNGEKYLDEQILSIVRQTYVNMEIIIVDDVSVDNTVNIIQRWMQRDKRIVLHQNSENLGYNRNFEKAIKLAAGDFIALSDQDDIWLAYKIEKLLSKFDCDEVMLTHAPSIELINGRLHFPKGKLLPTFTGDDPKKLFYDNQISGHKIMFRRSLVEKIIPIPPNMFYDWWIGVIATCNGAINAEKMSLVQYRIHGQNNHINVPKHIKAKHIDHITAWKYFLQIREMKDADKSFLKELIEVVQNHHVQKKLFDYRLFNFLLKHRHIIFFNRRKLATDFLLIKFIFYYTITKF